VILAGPEKSSVVSASTKNARSVNENVVPFGLPFSGRAIFRVPDVSYRGLSNVSNSHLRDKRTCLLRPPHNEMKLKQNNFKTVLNLFSFIQLCGPLKQFVSAKTNVKRFSCFSQSQSPATGWGRNDYGHRSDPSSGWGQFCINSGYTSRDWLKQL